MTIDRIQYQKVFPISAYCTERIGLEASLDKGENPEEALNKLKVIVDTLHAETLTQLDLCRGSKVVDVQSDKMPDEIQVTLDGINACTEIEGVDGLKSYWLRSKGNLTLSSAYKTKEKQLTDAK